MKRLCKLFIILFVLIVGLIFSATNVEASVEIKKPIVLSLNQNDAQYINKPLITGLTHTNTEVLIYVDGEYDGNAQVNTEQTETDNFYYQVKRDLHEGIHTISALAKDKTSLRLSEFSQILTFTVKQLPAPILIQPNKDAVTGKIKPTITGLTVNNTFVHVFVDGKHNGKTKILKNVSGTANFSYKPFLNLTTGWHTAWARAEDKNGRVSEVSNVLRFYIENQLPAPTLIKVDSFGTKLNKPFISGLSKNNTKIRVFIDEQLNGEFLVNNHPSGTASFSYLPFVDLSSGEHIIYVTAVDARGKESVWSNIIYYNILNTQTTVKQEEINSTQTITNKEEKQVSIQENKENKTNTIEDGDKNNNKNQKTEDLVEEKEPLSEDITVDSELKEILNIQESSSTDEVGSINEDKEQQAKLKLNLVIFIFFLFAVIGWIFWVNRELIKERQEQNKEDKK